MVEPAANRDAALLLDMLMAARDVRGFVAGLDESAFMASRLHQNAVMQRHRNRRQAIRKWLSVHRCCIHVDLIERRNSHGPRHFHA